VSWSTTVVVTLVGYQLILVSIGLWARSRTADTADYFLGGRQLGPTVAAISASASSSSAWSLLGVSGAAFAWGLSAAWLIPATLLGFCINWFWIAPRLQRQSLAGGSITLTEFLAEGMPQRQRLLLMRLAAIIILFSFSFYIAAQFQAAGKTFSGSFELSENSAILIGAGIVLFYVFIGGFWAASITDTFQGLLMALTAVLLPVAAIHEVGGLTAFISQLGLVADPAWTSFNNQPGALMSIGFVVGLLGIGLGYPGQPHVVNRFMAMKNSGDIPRARTIALGWAAVIYTGMVILGWCGRLLAIELGDQEQILFAAAKSLLPAMLAGIVIAAILSAIMSTADSQLLVAAASVSHDFSGAGTTSGGLFRARWVVVILGGIAIMIALFSNESIFNRVLFAWHAIGSALGPLLVVRLLRGHVQPVYRILSMLSGFGLTVILHWLPDTPGDIAERYIPLLLALLLAGLGSATKTRR
jgi:sodium/proline symporter